MPISLEELRAGRADLTLPIFKFLEGRSELAYTAEEVRGMLVQKLGKGLSLQEVIQALEELVKARHVEPKGIEGQRWYAIIKKARFPLGGKKMPITKREFQLGISQEVGELMSKIYDFLESRRDLAFTPAEILKETAPSCPTQQLENTLKLLVKIGAVEQRKIAEQAYYVFRKEFDTNAWRRKQIIRWGALRFWRTSK